MYSAQVDQNVNNRRFEIQNRDAGNLGAVTIEEALVGQAALEKIPYEDLWQNLDHVTSTDTNYAGRRVGRADFTYDPATKAWTLGADMPFAAGSVSTAVIRGRIFVAGGIVGSRTTDQVARYNPATNTWKVLAPMPFGRNHAASGTDGKKFYVFGGRGPGSGDANYVANGFDTVQVYNPVTGKWKLRAPLPQARGGPPARLADPLPEGGVVDGRSLAAQADFVIAHPVDGILAIEAKGHQRYATSITVHNGETLPHSATLVEMSKKPGSVAARVGCMVNSVPSGSTPVKTACLETESVPTPRPFSAWTSTS